MLHTQNTSNRVPNPLFSLYKQPIPSDTLGVVRRRWAFSGYPCALANWTRILGISTIGLVGATILNAYVLHKTDEAIHRSLEVLERDEQPYVGLTSVEGPFFDSVSNQLYWNFHYQNLGKRAAIKLSIGKFMKLAGEKFQEIPRGEGTLNFLGPNESAYTSLIRENVTPEQFESLMGTEEGFTGLIEFKYTDPLNRQLSTAFCAARNPNDTVGMLNAETCKSELR
jgi:hypothetical protein